MCKDCTEHLELLLFLLLLLFAFFFHYTVHVYLQFPLEFPLNNANLYQFVSQMQSLDAFCFFSPEHSENSFIGASQKTAGPAVPVHISPEIPLLGPQSNSSVTPLDIGRLQSRTVHSVLRKMKMGEEGAVNTTTPAQEESRGSLQKELQLDTPSRFLSRDRLFGPSFNTKVSLYLPLTSLMVHSC